jgi:hypothetical protein
MFIFLSCFLYKTFLVEFIIIFGIKSRLDKL